MGDVFNEQIVQRKPNMRDKLKKFGIIIAAGLLAFLAFVMIPSFGFFVAFAICFAAYYVLSFLNVEYEYVFTNGDLDIDVIYNRSRRKRLFSGQVSNFDIMCHIDDKVRIGEFAGAEVTKDYSSGMPGDNTYAFLTNHNSKRMKIIIEPNEKLLKAISTVLTRRKLFIKQ